MTTASLITTLSPAERLIFDLVRQGKTNNEVAGELALSETTVKWHMGNMFKKLGVKNRAAMIAYGATWDDCQSNAGERMGVYVPPVSGGKSFTEADLRAAAKRYVELGLGDRKVVNEVVLDLLGILGGTVK